MDFYEPSPFKQYDKPNPFKKKLNQNHFRPDLERIRKETEESEKLEHERQLKSKRDEMYIDDEDDYILEKNDMDNFNNHESRSPRLKRNMKNLNHEIAEKIR